MTQLSYLWYIYWKDIWPWGFEGQSGLQMAMIYYSIFSNWHSKLRQQSHKNLLLACFLADYGHVNGRLRWPSNLENNRKGPLKRPFQVRKPPYPLQRAFQCRLSKVGAVKTVYSCHQMLLSFSTSKSRLGPDLVMISCTYLSVLLCWGTKRSERVQQVRAAPTVRWLVNRIATYVRAGG